MRTVLSEPDEGICGFDLLQGRHVSFAGELQILRCAQAYVLNATVVPSPTLSYLMLWPNGEPQPEVSTLNAIDGFVASNMAIVPSTDGKVDAFAFGTTQMILDISSYFAP